MHTQYWNAIAQGQATRQDISQLRALLKDAQVLQEVQQLAVDAVPSLLHLLAADDAKTRKNAALLIGDLQVEGCLDALFSHYQQESQRFVRSAYLTAMQAYDCSSLLTPLQAQLDALAATPLTAENQKHVEEEMRELSKLLLQETGINMHTFVGCPQPMEVILITNRLQQQVTEQAVLDVDETAQLVPFEGGVRVRTQNVQALLRIRTYTEMLVVIPGSISVKDDPIKAARHLAQCRMMPFLKQLHAEAPPFYFRLALKNDMPLDEKSEFAKILTAELERCTLREMVNSTSNYEIELRLIANKTGGLTPLLKLFTLPDTRFNYRKESVAASIRPAQAALLVALASPFMKDNARVLDSFCGVGTMLIERQKMHRGHTSYGIDFYAPAIEKARLNTESAGQIIHYVNKNFLDFTHEHQFDEIFTNMPFVTPSKSYDDIAALYYAFFPKAKEVLAPQGTMILYSRNPELIDHWSTQFGYEILAAEEIVRKENAWIFVLQFVD